MKNIPAITFFIIAIIGYLLGGFTGSPIFAIIWIVALIIAIVKLFTKKK